MRLIPTARVITGMSSLASYIVSPQCKSIVFLTGAGMSCSSGIPDFRSEGGLYDTLQPDLISCSDDQRKLIYEDPTSVVSFDIFKETSLPYLEVRRPLILGTRSRKWKATLAHRVIELIQKKLGSKLTRIYTQNIDGLDYQCTHIPDEKIVAIHGSISKASCECCSMPMDYNEFCDKVQRQIRDIYTVHHENPKESSPIVCNRCGLPFVKPSTVLYGRDLPDVFFENWMSDIKDIDLLMIAGTSLVVSPANSLVDNVPSTTQRVVINKEPVGEFLGINYSSGDDGDKNKRDFFAQGDCDEIFLQIADKLGWTDDLIKIKNELPEKSRLVLEGFEPIN